MVILFFLDCCIVEVLVAGTSKLGMLSVEKETGAITRSEKISICDKNLFISVPKTTSNNSGSTK